ncbi:hypothetical protein ACIGCZ_04330 [Streptomyces nigra]|uniref:hypothetical protein n=1 Tax=Streptomyces nigra TaxID=1827580 RepID=UPI0037D38BC2
MAEVIAVIALLFVLFVALGVFATVKVVGAAKRSADKHITQARRTVEDHTLKAKALGRPGPAGEVAQLRLTLRTSMRATQEALEALAVEDGSVKESLALFQRLSAHGHELDAELRRLESEPDRATLAARLPDLRERTERIAHSADSLRWAARDRARRFADDDLDSLSTQIDMEAGALRHWQTAESESSPTASSAPAARAASEPARAAEAPERPAPPPWPEAPATEPGTAPQQTWPDTPRTRQAEEPTRPAISPAAPRPTYPWQKKPRPESTT